MSSISRRILSVASAGALLLIASAAQASIFDLSFSGSDATGSVSGTLQIDATLTATPGQYTLNSISGQVSDSAIAGGPFTLTGLFSSYAGADNFFFYPTQPYVSYGGLSFTTVGGGDFNLGLGGSGPFGGYLFNASLLNLSGNAQANTLAGSTSLSEFTVTEAVPEPSTWAMMILGFVGVGYMTYRRRKQSTALSAA